MSHLQTPSTAGPRGPYLRVLRWVFAVWVVSLALLVAGFMTGIFHTLINLTDLIVIAAASGGIAVLSMLPGILGPAPSGSTPAAASGRLAMNLFAGMGIRLAGTVALFLTCRYHMATSSEMIAGMTIGWYVLLTSVEVFVLARELPKTVKAPSFPETSLG